MIDRATVFTDILARQQLRREAKLPLLDVRHEYTRIVEWKLWKEHVEQHGAEVRARVLDDLTRRFGHEPQSAGGRWALNALTHKALRESFNADRPL